MKSWDDVFGHRSAFVPGSGCWLFEGAWTSAGYGNVRFKSENWLAHRLSFVILGGVLTSGDVLCHSCDTPACINPAHLFVGSLHQNSQDMARKERHVYGERHHMARLTAADVLDIRGSALTDGELAKKLGVCRATVSYARNASTWKQVALRQKRAA